MLMLVDCETCPVRDIQCADCVMTALGVSTEAAAPPGGTSPLTDTLPLDRGERRAVSILAAAGLVTAEVANAARAVRDPEPAPVTVRRARAAG